MFSKLFCVLVIASVLDARFNSRAFRFNTGPDCEVPTIEHGKVRTRPRSRVIKFTCLNKYTLVGNRYATCNNGGWDEPQPVCIKSSPNCSISPVENGIVVPTHDNAYVTFFCLPEYRMVGNRTVYCDGRRWVGEFPTCIKHGIVVPTHDNAYVTFFCLPEYRMVGNRTVYCDGRRWVGEFPTCINSTSPPLLSCDFETQDLCGWRQDEFHDFDWRRWNKRTPSSMLHTGPDADHTLGKNKSELRGWRQDEFHDFDWRRWNKRTPSSMLHTGPDADHTLGRNNSGYYMYIESTSQAVNSSARLLSPIYDRKLALDGCFKFYYHMYGDTTGGLRVFQKPDNLSLITLLYYNATERARYLLFEKWGNQGNEWFQYSGKLTDFGDNFQIVIEGIRGPDFLSDIAIDDVELLQGENCTASVTYTGAPIESCAGRCMQNDTESTFCGCTVDCILNGNCCPDFYDTCVFVDRFTFPYDDLPSGLVGEKMPQTEKLVGTTPNTNNTEKELPTSTTQEIDHASQTTVITQKATVTTQKLTVTTPKITVTTPKMTVTIPMKTTTVPAVTETTVTISTTKKSIPKLVFKTTEAIIKHEDKKTTVKPVTVKTATVKPVTVTPVTVKPVTVTPVTTTTVTVKLTTVKPQLTTALNRRRSSNGLKSQDKVSASQRTNKNSGITSVPIIFLLLGLVCVIGTTVWFLRTARIRRVIADLRGRSVSDPEVRYLTSHADED